MAKLVVMAVMDVAAMAFHRPIFVASLGVGVRIVSDEVNRQADDNLLFKHARDFRIFHLGSWDDNSGLFESLPQPLFLADCVSLLVKSDAAFSPSQVVN